MSVKFDDIKFSMPEESDEQRKTRLQKMSQELLDMIMKVRAESAKSADTKLKNELNSAAKSLETIQEKLQNTIH
mgnify:CR=1 FL=1